MAEKTYQETVAEAKAIRKPAKPFRWLGGIPPGVLHVRVNDVVKTYGPGDLVKEAAHLAELGEQRVADLIKEGFAEAVNFVEGVLNIVKEVPGAMSDTEKAQVQTVAQEVVSAHVPQQAASKAKVKNMKSVGEKPEQAAPLNAGPAMASPSRS